MSVTADDLVAQLAARIAKDGQSATAKALGVSSQYLWNVVNKFKRANGAITQPGAKLYTALGYKRITLYQSIRPQISMPLKYVRAEMVDRVKERGAANMARTLGVSAQDVRAVVAGKVPSAAVVAALGLRKITRYVRVRG